MVIRHCDGSDPEPSGHLGPAGIPVGGRRIDGGRGLDGETRSDKAVLNLSGNCQWGSIVLAPSTTTS